MVRVRVRDIASLSAGDVARWSELADAAATPNPFLDPRFLLPAAERRADDPPRLLVATDGAGDWTGLMPVRRGLRWRRLVGPVSAWTDAYSYLDAPLVRQGSAPEAVEALVHGARRQAALIAFDRLPLDSDVGDAVLAASAALGGEPVLYRRFERAALRRRGADDYVASSLTGKQRADLRRRRRTLAAACGGDVAVGDRAGQAQAVEDFLALEAGGWKGERGTALASSGHASFFRAMCRGFAEAGGLQLLSLHAGDRLVAMECSLIAGAGLFGFKLAHDESLARHGPGIQLIAAAASAFHDRAELRFADSCSEPGSDAVERLWPDRRSLATVLLPGARAGRQVMRAQAALATRLRARLREGGP